MEGPSQYHPSSSAMPSSGGRLRIGHVGAIAKRRDRVKTDRRPRGHRRLASGGDRHHGRLTRGRPGRVPQELPRYLECALFAAHCPLELANLS